MDLRFPSKALGLATWKNFSFHVPEMGNHLLVLCLPSVFPSVGYSSACLLSEECPVPHGIVI
jgi:hypothetical protein